ncbi:MULTISPECIES: antitoxin Xre/MbcA/ParS toxin-binding domain-containing protein [Burkholderia]|uniref:antitoxin Xre/MbcA/ParS toxin-binding domain-containing protein n=1 Tax=Burkholderia TaxID=32008 RepID=UPI0009816CBB|nr:MULTISPECIES: antitoxin Xre/MbcA/ParS toxin-binding domain-containing protein [Burkholderia]MBG0880685.1 DUF2384 domain-containing protein [Burkholderia sp. 9775_39]MBG0886713.1 DUF2384 domain-containing protein [Burkholderia sp. 9773_38]PNF08206.1 DUF2384 domain-containing protein [Burkholderia cenocepacia]RSC41196.1 DUF2384 domain-containing protein [Burkholderia cenocepacia]
MPFKQPTGGRTTATKSNRQHVDSKRWEAAYGDIKNSLDQFDVPELRRLIGKGMETNIVLRIATDFPHEPIETLFVGPRLPYSTTLRSIVEMEHLSPEESDRIARTIYIFGQAIDVFESKGLAAAWMQLPRAMLSGLRPLDMLDTQTGFERMRDLLTRIAHGVSA